MSDTVEDLNYALSNSMFKRFVNEPPDSPFWNARGRPHATIAGAKRTAIGHVLTTEEEEWLNSTMLCYVPWKIIDGILWRYELYE
jgi:hypothetical protein